MADSKIEKAKTHCPKGHPYAGENLQLDHRGKRYCKECVRINRRENREKYREADRQRAARNPEARREKNRRWRERNHSNPKEQTA